MIQALLHGACAKGDVEGVKSMVEGGISVDRRDKVRLLCVCDQCCVVEYIIYEVVLL